MTRRRAIAAVLAVVVAIGLAAWLAGPHPDDEGTAADRPVRAHAAAVDSGGRVFAAVERLSDDGRWHTAVAREDGGALDPGFAPDVPVANPRGIAVEGSGHVLIAGDRTVDGHHRLAVARINPDGRVDASFGNGGVVTLAAGDGDALARAVVSGPGTGTVVVGDARDGDRHAMVIAYLTPDGQSTRVKLVPDTAAAGAATDRDGNAIVAGTDARTGDPVLAQILSGGQIQTTRARTRLTGARWSAIGVTPDGGAVVVGSGRDQEARSVVAVQRFGPGGDPAGADQIGAGDGDAYGTAVAIGPGGLVTIGATGVQRDRPAAFVTTLGAHRAPTTRGTGDLVALLPESVLLVNRWDGQRQIAALIR